MKCTTLLLAFFMTIGVNAQSMIEKMFKQKRYEEIIAYAPKTDKLGGRDIFRIGQSFIKLKQDEQAIEMFNKAINKGYKDGEIYFAKGIAETNLELYYQAQSSFRQALYFMPNRKKVLIELAACYYKSNELDSALKTYQTLESNWGDYWPALVMSCQIMHEQGKPRKALDCYYGKLRHLQKDKYYYRVALEDVMRLEWHSMKNYGKAEVALKNLMEAYPNNYEYNVLLLQLYNTTGRYTKAKVQEEYVLDGYKNLKLPQKYYNKGVVLVDAFDTAQYQVEVYRNFQPEKHQEQVYRAFIFNANGSRPLGKIAVVDSDTAMVIAGYRIADDYLTEESFSYESFKYCTLFSLFLPETPDNESIIEE